MTLAPPCSASAPGVLSCTNSALTLHPALFMAFGRKGWGGAGSDAGQCWLSAGQERAQEQLWKPGLPCDIKLWVIHIFFRLCAYYMKSSSSMLMSSGSFGGKATNPTWLGMCWGICLVIHCNQTHCSSPTPPPSSFLATVSVANISLLQQLGSFPCKSFMSLVTRANGICYNLSSGCLQEWCGCWDVPGVRSLWGCCRDGEWKYLFCSCVGWVTLIDRSLHLLGCNLRNKTTSNAPALINSFKRFKQKQIQSSISLITSVAKPLSATKHSSQTCCMKMLTAQCERRIARVLCDFLVLFPPKPWLKCEGVAAPSKIMSLAWLLFTSIIWSVLCSNITPA